MQQHGIVDFGQDIEKSLPKPTFISGCIGPKMVAHSTLRAVKMNTDQIEEVTIRNPLDIENHRRTLDPQLDLADHVRLPLANRESLQRVMILFGSRCKSLRATAGSKSVRELIDCENPFLIQTCSFSFRQTA